MITRLDPQRYDHGLKTIQKKIHPFTIYSWHYSLIHSSIYPSIHSFIHSSHIHSFILHFSCNLATLYKYNIFLLDMFRSYTVAVSFLLVSCHCVNFMWSNTSKHDFYSVPPWITIHHHDPPEISSLWLSQDHQIT